MTAVEDTTRLTTTARRPRALLWWALGLIAAFVLMGLAVLSNPTSPFTQAIDNWWRGINGAAPDSGAYTWVLPMFFQYLGEAPGALLNLLIIVCLFAVGRWRSALFYLSAYLTAMVVLSIGMKNLVDRPRPAVDETLGLYGPLFDVDHGSFPSGHATATAFMAFAVAALIPLARTTARRVWWIVAAVLMTGMVWQRTLINGHWISDAVFGLIAGAAAALLMCWAYWPLLRQDDGRPVWFLHLRKRAA